ncbi:hypothetical protein AOQ84DRAFT_210194 [Glonium stellatum]|uniref:Uncharacterized protein n=1 Tax=Glonium stellatum TaxID=574774 RepID=A0A8E2JYU6_9PEZI|nr:hypothetical protein AOQ84DRAFT_210194 [Glonium stellatum]
MLRSRLPYFTAAAAVAVCWTRQKRSLASEALETPLSYLTAASLCLNLPHPFAILRPSNIGIALFRIWSAIDGYHLAQPAETESNMYHPADSTLLGIPLELRHRIFGYLSERDEGPANLLKNWFEKKELEQLIGQHAASIAANSVATPGAQDDDGEDASEEGGDEENEDGEDGDNEEEEEEEDEDIDEEEDDSDGHAVDITTATATRTGPPLPPVSHKWRHIPSIFSLTHCPPPMSLLLVCKQLHAEAIAYYYDCVTLRIDATAGFEHVTFFEETMDQLASSAFSPTEPIRKFELIFTWDTEWLRASEAYESVFQAMLYQRAQKTEEVLKKAPRLNKVHIKWYDSLRDLESLDLQMNILQGFWNLLSQADVDMEEHFLEAGTEPDENSIQGQRRVQFEQILAHGQNFC